MDGHWEGVVKKLLPGTMFDVELKQGNNTLEILCVLAGKLKQNFIKSWERALEEGTKCMFIRS